MKYPLRYLDKTALRNMRIFAVNGLYWMNQKIRLAQKTGDTALLRYGLGGRKHYKHNIALVDEEMDRRRGRCKQNSYRRRKDFFPWQIKRP